MELGYFLDNSENRRHNQYAIVIFLPAHLDKTIASLREKYDPKYNLISPHITLVYPFESKKSLDELAAVVKMETDSRDTIRVKLNSIGDFYPRIPAIYWNIAENEKLTQLYFHLYSRLGIPVPFKQYLPHVTVAQEISYHRVMLVKEKIVNYLPDEEFLAKAIDLITPLPGGKWVSVRTFPLTG
ncbi:MAG: 2'-5' RNA ligase family protein [candidate division Zixibacteria bacterium]|nr:2'-5' RNA ligase family protein [candidate division Zixibacteria bacterium]